MSKSLHFCASDDDLHLILAPILEKHKVRIYRVDCPQGPSPQLIAPVEMQIGTTNADQQNGGTAYLLLPEAIPIQVETRTLITGKTIWIVNQLLNNESVVLRPLGRRPDNVVIAGTIGTAWDSDFAAVFLGEFLSKLRKKFKKIRAFWVGPKALEILRGGGRLTQAIQSPPMYDLKE